MANRRCIQNLNRHFQFLRTRTPHLNPQFLAPTSKFTLHPAFTPKSLHRLFNSNDINPQSVVFRHFCSKNRNDDTDEEEVEDDDDDYESEGQDIESADDERENETAALSPEDKEKEAAEIGYKVISPLQKSDRVFKPYEPVFAVVQLILNKVLMLGSKTQTIIGRPILPDAAVHAVVEEHALDAKVIIFKKKRRKNYRRTKGHRQELTKLRITDISGIEKPENMPSLKTEKKEKIPSLKTEKKEKQEKMPVAA
ncbi:50S ribosomal protein L21, mitochondrial-like isoform X2 [Olea europaea var. sylvestris]|uniref:50S ribosomal protein L21, mitochondrial-like isoform X2 n=1 Tax=Olea europaea var. sylvestris TaxID=158386 RepID=UPI000C1D1633|nr:50S ribosomal protein L21, mitochondrial-like isoform X2 [Olea europaea var. sylvestris]